MEIVKLSDMETESLRHLVGEMEAAQFRVEAYIRRLLQSAGINGEDRYGVTPDLTALVKQKAPEPPVAPETPTKAN